jgi:hypothetical protein
MSPFCSGQLIYFGRALFKNCLPDWGLLTKTILVPLNAVVVTGNRQHQATVYMDSGSSSKEPDRDSIQLPPPGQEVFVRCAGFRCLAVRDAAGKWRNAAEPHEELPEVLEIMAHL